MKSGMEENLNQLIQQCIKGNRLAQHQLYELLAPKMFVKCLRYLQNRELAEENLQEGFLTVFEKLHQFKFEGAFEGWVGRIMINCALQKLRSKTRLHAVQPLENADDPSYAEEVILADLDAKDLLKIVQQLPTAYRLVFNLYVFEGYKHREIAEMLGIREGTSKSNLSDARNILRKNISRQTESIKQHII